ncbi:hypothetical protein Hrd1104_09400 [Halorhabdus sp. CBA1104]|uniref:hypothetical protein n=1 Tax=unclassified Halorhabdus TaxID=2621901 RepID=UPI0012B43989|nr:MULTISPECIES: hypothetical protein [unclassified Halorhabdus]QGN07499.1 hypothetical protein Hrd1104_09400 [Halorhabdus sp. CBA1104]
MKQPYRRVDRRLREWRRTRPLVWGTLYGGVPAICFAGVLTAFGQSPLRAGWQGLLFGVVFAGLSAWTTRQE